MSLEEESFVKRAVLGVLFFVWVISLTAGININQIFGIIASIFWILFHFMIFAVGYLLNKVKEIEKEIWELQESVKKLMSR